MTRSAGIVHMIDYNHDSRYEQAAGVSRPSVTTTSAKTAKTSSSEWIENKSTMAENTVISEKQSDTSDVLQTEGVITRTWTDKEERKLKLK